MMPLFDMPPAAAYDRATAIVTLRVNMVLTLQDIRYGARQLMKSPAFLVISVLILALGIGATTAIFSVVDAVLLNKFPYTDPDRLVMLWEKNPALGAFVGDRVQTNYLNFQEWRKQSTSFEAIGGFEDASFNLTGGDRPELIAGARASANLFTVFGVTPLLGTSFDFAETDPGRSHVVLLSYFYYQSHFGGLPGVLGRALTLNDVTYTVIGVLPAGFYLPATREGAEQRKPRLWIPYDLSQTRSADDLTRRKIQVFGRLKRGVTLEQAREEMSAVGKRLEEQNPLLNAGFGTNLFPLYVEDVGRELRHNLFLLFAAVGFVLLIACANIANLTLTRAVSRQKELAICKALGATQLRLTAQLLVESLMLSVLGGVLGLLLAHFGIQALLALKPAGILRPEGIHLNVFALLFASAAVIAAGVLSGLMPALQAIRFEASPSLRQAGAIGLARDPRRLRRLLAITEVALAVVLLTGATFMARSLLLVMGVDPGFRPDHLLTMRLNLPASRYANNQQLAAFCRQVLERVSTLPGVKASAFSDGLPMIRIRMMRFLVEGRPIPKPGSETTADMRGITTPDYFGTLDLPILKGRNFTRDEIDRGLPVIIMNQSLAKKLWPDEDAIGKRIRSVTQKPGAEPAWLTVIGVVKDARQLSLEAGTRPEIIRPMLDYTILTLSLRTVVEPGLLTPAVEKQVWFFDKDLPVYSVRTMQDIVDDSFGQRRFDSVLMVTFAAVALILAAVGIYGVLASLTSQRTREIGVRMALGARPGDVLRMILLDGLRLAALGLLAGIALAAVLSQWLAGLFFGVSPENVTTYAIVCLVMALVALAACYLPARRAIRVDPTSALRAE
ncbi:MAG: ABC transporter permease [Acidobacteriia bacterium]|nr:ABC transporter permease [Terriglobia bacterium]